MKKRTLQIMLTSFFIAGLFIIYFLDGFNLPLAEQSQPSYETETGSFIQNVGGSSESGEMHGVSAAHPLAVQIGMEILDEGGNAVDAAIAVSYALGVLEPHSSGIGGGGEMLIHSPEGEATSYNYRESAPRSGQMSPLHIGVPGFVKGMERAHSDFGSLDFAQVIEPAITLAEEGFEVNEYTADRLNKNKGRLQGSDIHNLFPNGRPIEAGETLSQPELARTLGLIQQQGAEAFYKGEIGRQMINQLEHIDKQDLRDYKVKKEEPLTGEYEGYEVLTPGPPTGGVTLIQILQMAEMIDLQTPIENGEEGLAEYMHTLGEMTNVAYEDRLSNVADPDYTHVPVDTLTSEQYLQELLENVLSKDQSSSYTIGESKADRENHQNTTHIVVVDGDGMMVSATNTLSQVFGSGIYVGGFFLNNQLSNFSETSTSPNLPEAGKQPRSYITPTILAKDGKPVIGIGSPGGKRIPAVLAQVLIDFHQSERTLQESIDEPRFYVENQEIFIEGKISEQTIKALHDYGYNVRTEYMTSPLYFGSVQGIHVDVEQQELHGGADQRRGGEHDIYHSDE